MLFLFFQLCSFVIGRGYPTGLRTLMEVSFGFYPTGLNPLWGAAPPPIALTNAGFMHHGASAPELLPTLTLRGSASCVREAINIKYSEGAAALMLAAGHGLLKLTPALFAGDWVMR